MVSSVRVFFGVGEHPGREKWAKEKLQVHETLLTELANPAAHRCETGAPSWKERRLHLCQYIYLSLA